MLRQGMFIAERYEILEKIGSGGMSDVYKAKCHKLNRYVAIKVLKPEYCEDKTFVAKFRDEAQSAAGLMHANIVNVYDVGEENGIYYIIMELVEGITLKKYIEKKGKLGIREAVSVAVQVAQGIEAAHKHHIVHRDIKPQNIIISKDGKVKVTDFGIARAASSNTINSSVMGSVHYISPEQARGGYSDEKSDIYSFGITLFEMLTGKVPFEGDTTVAIALQHIQDDMVSPKEYIPDIPVSVEKIVIKCTQKKTDRRYQNMGDLIADLKRSLVSPDEDFVVISSAVVPDGATQMIDDDDLAEINQKSSTIDDLDDSEEDFDKEFSIDDYDEETEEGEDVDDDGYVKRTATSKKIDTVITILGIAVGVVILAIAIIVIVKMTSLFKGNTNSTTNPIATIPSTTVDDGKIVVPSVLGYSREEAQKALNDVGLGMDPREDYSELYPEGQVYETNYQAGERVAPNTTVIVYISLGTAKFKMPDVVGRLQSEADTILRSQLLVPEYNIEDTDDAELAGKVISTDPIADSMVKAGDKVIVSVYKVKGQQVATVPNVIGETRENAEATLNSKGFKNINCSYEYDDEVEANHVISQGGATIGKDADIKSTITLVISQGPKPTEEVTTEETTTENVTTTESETTTNSDATTEGSTTEEATTEAPTTEAPTTEASTEAPTTEEVTTEAPTTEEVTTEETTTEEETTE